MLPIRRLLFSLGVQVILLHFSEYLAMLIIVVIHRHDNWILVIRLMVMADFMAPYDTMIATWNNAFN